MSLPPVIDDADLIVRLWSGATVDSPPSTQLIDQRGRRARPARLRGRPGCQQRLVQCLTLLVGQIVTVIVDDQLQLGALRQLGRFVEVQSPVLHTRAQWGHVITVRPPTAAWQADREDG